jgi:nucleoside-diphosphate-sugar epimerase
MVIGNGMIAKAFSSYAGKDKFVIFASGVSDSAHPSAAGFEREKELLLHTIHKNPGTELVYFSTCSVYDISMKDSEYVRHKKNMEELIIRHQTRYTIFRLSNPVGRTENTNTVVNFFIGHILAKQHFEVWKQATRNIIDIDDVYKICNEILQKRLFPNSIINIANPQNYPVTYVIETLEKHFDSKANYTLVDKGSGPQIDLSRAEPLFKKFNINFDQQYLSTLLQKYFPAK